MINQLWFPLLSTNNQPSNASDTPKSRKDRSVSMEDAETGGQIALPSQVNVMVKVAGNMRERLSPLEEILRVVCLIEIITFFYHFV